MIFYDECSNFDPKVWKDLLKKDKGKLKGVQLIASTKKSESIWFKYLKEKK